jgi:hypothetical protein
LGWIDSADKADNRLDHRFRLIAVREMAAILELDEIHVGSEPSDPVDLLHRAVKSTESA